MKQCKCGWLRPLIGLTTIGGGMPPANVLPIYLCPQCGDPHVPVELAPLEAVRIVVQLLEQLARERAKEPHA